MKEIIGKTSIELEKSDVEELITYALKEKYGYEVENISINVGNQLSGFGAMEMSIPEFRNVIVILK